IDALLYTKNYLKRYAGYLGFTPDEIEAMIESIPVEDKSYQHLKLNTEIKNKENRRKKSFILRLYFFVVILILASVYLYFTLDKHGDFFKNGIAPTPQDEAIIDESDVPPPLTEQIGRASCRERVNTKVYDGTRNKKQKKNNRRRQR